MVQEKNVKKQSVKSNQGYQRTRMQKELVIRKLKEQGCRITKQRLVLLDVILSEECASCKEIFYRASQKNPNIGAATVYRMINTLEEIGAISRKNMYRIDCERGSETLVYTQENGMDNGESVCTIELDDATVHHLSAASWNNVLLAGLRACGYAEGQKVKSVVWQS